MEHEWTQGSFHKTGKRSYFHCSQNVVSPPPIRLLEPWVQIGWINSPHHFEHFAVYEALLFVYCIVWVAVPGSILISINQPNLRYYKYLRNLIHWKSLSLTVDYVRYINTLRKFMALKIKIKYNANTGISLLLTMVLCFNKFFFRFEFAMCSCEKCIHWIGAWKGGGSGGGGGRDFQRKRVLL